MNCFYCDAVASPLNKVTLHQIGSSFHGECQVCTKLREDFQAEKDLREYGRSSTSGDVVGGIVVGFMALGLFFII